MLTISELHTIVISRFHLVVSSMELQRIFALLKGQNRNKVNPDSTFVGYKNIFFMLHKR